jgi:AcrR family transcriptional regulator
MSRPEILAAARRLSNRPGASFTMAEVAGEARLARATLYRAFSSRAALLAALRAEGLELAPDADPAARAVDAVERILLRDGFGGLTMEAVAAEAGASLATLYRRFGDREGLLRDFVRRRGRRAELKARLDGPVGSPGELEAILVRFTETALAALEDGRALFRLALAGSEETGALLRKVRDAPRGATAALAGFLDAQMKAGRLRPGDPATLAAAFTGQLFSLAVILPASGANLPARPALARSLVDTFLRGTLR